MSVLRICRKRAIATLLALFSLASLSVAAATVPGQAADGQAAEPTSVRHLPSNLQGFRLAGENASLEWPVYLTAAQAGGVLRFQVGYLSAVSVMPEASLMKVTINDVAIGTTHLRAAGALRVVTFDIPSSLAKPGFNSVRISVEQRHRVDCSVQATYELWTQIDPAATGLLTPAGDPGVRDLSDLAALAPDDEGALPIRVVATRPQSPQQVERLLRAVSAVSLAGRFEQPLVDIGPAASGLYGVNLFVGDAAELGAEGFGFDPHSMGSGPRVWVLPPRNGLRTTIVIAGASGSDVDAAIDEVVAAQQAEGTPSGLRALDAISGLRAKGGERIAFRELRVHSEEFGGRLFRTSFAVTMPVDFYPADYGKLIIDLDGAYAAGLAAGAEVLVKINERDAASLRLAKSGGDLLKDEKIPVPLSYLRPGLNRVEIEAHVPTPADKTCDPLATLSGGKRFLFLDASQIEIPPIARIARFPDLSVTATGGFPALDARSLKLWLPLPDRESVAAAASLAAQFSRAAGVPLRFEATTREPAPDDGPVLVVGPANAIDRDLLAAVGVDAAQLEFSWRNAASESRPAGQSETAPQSKSDYRHALERDLPTACHSKSWPVEFTAGHPVRSEAADESEGGDAGLADAWRDRLNRSQDLKSKLLDLPALAGRLLGAITARVLNEGEIAPSAGAQNRRRDSLLVGQALLGSDAHSLWTFVTAPDSASLAEAAGCLVDPRVWRKLAGRLALVDASNGEVATIAAEDTKLVVTQPLSIQNVRLIAAGWLSLNPGAYVCAALSAALALAFSTAWFVRNVGRRGQ